MTKFISLITERGPVLVKYKFQILLVFALLIFSTIFTVSAEEILPEVNFSEGYIIAEGTGVVREDIRNEAQAIALAKLAAKVDAQRNLLEIIAGLQIDSETTMKNLMADDVVRTKVEGILQGAQVVPNQEYLQAGIYHIQLKVNIEGLKSLYLNPPVEEQLSVEQSSTDKNLYTSLIINAQDFTIEKLDYLEIRDIAHNLIYSTSRSLYSNDNSSILKASKANALADPRAGDNPLFVSALKVDLTKDPVIVLSREDGQMVLAELQNTDIFLLSKILIITGGSTDEK